MRYLLSRYIMSYVFNAILMTLLLILSLDFIASIVDQSEDLSEQYTFLDSLLIALLELPGEIYVYLPGTMLIGSLIGLGILSSSNEITVMRSAGISKMRIFGTACVPVVAIALAGLFIIEYVTPACFSKLVELERQVKGYPASKQNRNSIWNREGNNFIHMREFRDDGVLEGVTMFRFNEDHRLGSVLHAKQASHRDKKWELEEVTLVTIEDQQTRAESLPRFTWPSRLNPRLLGVLTEEPEHLSTTDLWLNMRYRQGQSLDVASHAHTLWTRLLQPFTCAALLLIGISSIFGPMREATMGYRVFVGVLIGYSFNVAQEMLAQLTLAYQLPPLFIALMPIILIAAAGSYLISRN